MDNKYTADALIKRRSRFVALENADVTFAERFSMIFNPKLFSDVKKRITDLFEFEKESRPKFNFTSKESATATSWLRNQQYMNVRDLTVFVPRGLKVTYKDYLSALLDNKEIVLELNDRLISPISAAIGLLINNPSALTSRSGMPKVDIDPKFNEKSLEDCINKVSACFDKIDVRDTIRFGSAVKRIKEYHDVCKSVNDLQDELKRHKASDVEKNVLELYRATTSLAEEIESDEIYQQMSPEISEQLSNTILLCARWVEYYAIWRRQVMVLAAALEDTNKKIADIAKR